MANNRLYLRCKCCKEAMFLDKTYGEPYHITASTLSKVNKFLEEHAFCSTTADGGKFELYDDLDD